ncbi:MAG: 3-dehydroquinate synthase II [Candidatus Hodarchaeota archaeon]
MPTKKIIFQFIGNWEEVKPFYVEAITTGFTTFLVADKDHVEKIRQLGKVELINPAIESKPDFIFLDLGKKSENSNEYSNFLINKEKKCVMVSVVSKEDETKVINIANGESEIIIVDAEDWRVIPFENLIAEFQKTPSLLVSKVKDLEEARLFAETLEKGVDGIFISIDGKKIPAGDFNFNEWKQFSSASENIKMVLVKITNIKEIGSGDRVCVDTISMLNQGEGMLIGNQARGFFLLHGEIADTEFVNSRPFRVNAGAVHSYVLNPGNKTNYLSELNSGKEVLLVDWKGNTRITTVGRAKIETRPMILVEAEGEGESISAVIQNAETICLVDKNGKQISVSNLEVGDEVIAHVTSSKGRHFGKDIEEKIIEK